MWYTKEGSHRGKYSDAAACEDCLFESSEDMEEKSKRDFHGSRTREEIFKRTDFGILFEQCLLCEWILWNSGSKPGIFQKDAKNLTMSEAAFLSAIPNNPTIYDPRTNKENTDQT